MNPDLFRGVVPFVAVAEELSFRRAAARLRQTPAAVSKAVLTLEGELGVKLLTRTSRAVSLTGDGERFLARCRAAVAAVDGARTEVQDEGNAPHGEATVSVPFLLAPWMLEAMEQLRHRHPRLTVRLSVTDRIARLAAEGVDVAVRIGDVDDTSLVAHKLRDTRWVTVASPAYLAHRGTPSEPDELARHDCLVFVGPNGRARSWSFSSGSFTPHAVLLADHGPSILDAARAGLGLCQAFDPPVAEDLRRGRLVEVLAGYGVPGPALRALCVRDRRKSGNVRAVVEALAGAFASV
jgi:DNA-binding transcriptional LysR family regulator